MTESMTESSKMTPVRLGIFGCGAVALRCHLPALALTPEVRVGALVDSDVRQAEVAAEFMAGEGLGPRPAYVGDSLDAALPHIDAALVCTAHTSHGDVAGALLRAGVHVLVEKPLTTTVAQARELARLAADTGLVAQVGHVRRLFPAAVWVERALAAGDIGEPLRVRWREGGPYTWPLASPSMWRPDLAGGGVTLEVGAHVFDLLLSWFGGEAEVTGYADDYRGGVESESLTRLTLGPVEAEVELSRLRDLGNTLEIVGSEATLRLGTRYQTEYEIIPADGGPARSGTVPVLPPAAGAWSELFAAQLRSFARAVRLGEPPLADAEDGLRTVAIAETCYADKGRGTLALQPAPAAPLPDERRAELSRLKVLVTGASGFVGARTVERLVGETDAEVVAAVRGYERLARLSALDQSRLSFAVTDIDEPAKLAESFAGADVVIHCAYGNAGEVEARWRTSVEGTRNVVDAARDAGVRRVVVVSSVSVYAPSDAETLTEDSPLLAEDPDDREYGQQKLASELIALAGAGDGLEVVVVQPTVIYGPHGPGWTVRALTRMPTDSAVLPSGDEGTCNAVHVDDVVTSLLLAATVPAAAGRRFLISGAAATSWGRFYDSYRAMLPPATAAPEAGEGLPDWERSVYGSPSAVRIDAAREVLGYQPAYDLPSGMETVRAWAERTGLLG
ncbi:NAD-dependent epimerase/dehydratase family protein [Streptomyces sp. NPDC057509]|uniref:NAD-dependent epimerase/dehydratase family protein n=1 Tax=Streptomyces sp. NPDC057509 TaxID=3346152 RepID=UPI00368B6EFC